MQTFDEGFCLNLQNSSLCGHYWFSYSVLNWSLPGEPLLSQQGIMNQP